MLGSITSRCSGNEPALLPRRGRVDQTRESGGNRAYKHASTCTTLYLIPCFESSGFESTICERVPLPVWISSSLNPLVRALGTPHSVLIITLWKGWYQKSYPMGAAGPDSQRPLTSNVFPSRITKPPKRTGSQVWLENRWNLAKILQWCGFFFFQEIVFNILVRVSTYYIKLGTMERVYKC